MTEGGTADQGPALGRVGAGEGRHVAQGEHGAWREEVGASRKDTEGSVRPQGAVRACLGPFMSTAQPFGHAQDGSRGL